MLRFLIFALIVVSGLIAYLGDQIGMKIGKKRLSIFGIRPKYTSIIITILTGILIAAISISLLMVASSAIRRAVFNMEQLVVDLNQLSEQVKDKDRQLKSMQTDIEAKKSQLREIRDERDVIMTDKQILETEYEKVKASYEELLTTKEDLETKLSNLEEQKGQLKHQKEELDGEVNDLQQMVTKLKDELKTLTKRTENLAKGFMLSQMQNEQFKKQNQQYKNKDIIFRKDEIIYYDSLKTIPDATNEQILQVLNSYLAKASEVAQQHNVKIDKKSGKSIRLDKREVYTAVKALTNPSNQRILLIIRAKQNIPVDNYVHGYIQWDENYKIYNKGEVIGSKVIDSGLEPSVIKNELEQLLTEIKTKSIKKGLSTAMREDVGWLDLVDFYTIIDTIKEAPKQMRITIRAKRAIWREDYLSGDTIEYDFSPMGE